MKATSRRQFIFVGTGSVLSYLAAPGQDVLHHRRRPSLYFTPHVRPLPSLGVVKMKSVNVDVKINRQTSVTRMVIEMQNTHGTQQEGQALIPVPNGAVLKGYTLDGHLGKFSAKLLPRTEARRIYDSIVSQMKDPALLEFAADGVVKSSVFPIPANGSVKLELVYEMLLEKDGGRIDYYIPRSQSLDYKVPWKINLSWQTDQGVASVYSPSHPVQVKNVSPKKVNVKSVGHLQPGTFRLSLLTKNNKAAQATFYAYPEEHGKGGHFLMLLSPPDRDPKGPKIKREVTVVLDKSGSMAGEKMDQAKAAALQVIEGLEPGEAFNVIVYNEAVEIFSAAPVLKSEKTQKELRSYLKSIRVSGGTNINGALNTALKQESRKGFIPLVLFLTDGVPTIGETNEKEIKKQVAKANTRSHRIFCFGVGVDVNSPLLNSISTATKAKASYVLPNENVELKVAQVFRRLSGPVLQNPVLQARGDDGAPLAGIIADVMPNPMGDMYEQDQVVLLGRYTDDQKIRFVLSGEGASGKRDFTFTFDSGKASKQHGFVPRLWATRKISIMIQALRDKGGQGRIGGNTLDRHDPKVKELIDEIIRVSLRFGVLTEYTAFLATDGTPINRRRPQVFQMKAAANIESRALKERVGYGSLNQERNIINGRQASCLNPYNSHWDANMKQQKMSMVQQIGNKTYYQTGNTWNDAQQSEKEDEIVVAVGSEPFSKLVDELLLANEQGCLSLTGEVRVSVNGKNYLIR